MTGEEIFTVVEEIPNPFIVAFNSHHYKKRSCNTNFLVKLLNL